MCRSTISRIFPTIAVLVLAAMTTPASPQAARRDGSAANSQPLRSQVMRYFAGLPGYRPGDLITQSQVKPLLGQLTDMGVAVADPAALLASVPADGSFLARELRTRQGRKFMRYLGGTPEAYDRMERVSQMKRGQQTVRELISRGRKGADVFNYFAGHPDGKKAGKLMARRGQSSNFNKQTGKIYTVDQLLEELEKLQPPRLPQPVQGGSAQKVPASRSNPRAAPPTTAPAESRGS